jgi:predicted ribosome quality control (RQC) complex YloA/Tae2 family protein
MRKARENKKLLLCSLADQARVHLTAGGFTNPSSPPLFCMVLRKHLEGSFLAGIEQPALERVLKLHFNTFDELGRHITRLLVVEIMGKHSNIILLKPDGEIVDASRRYTHTVSRHREVLPGRPYVAPPPQDKADPRHLDDESFSNYLLSSNLNLPLQRLLVQKLSGIGPQTAAEILHRAAIPAVLTLDDCGQYELTRLWQALQEILAATAPPAWQAVVVSDNDQKPLAFAAFDLFQYDELPREYFASPSKACDSFYIARRQAQLLAGLRLSLEHTLQKELRRCRKKEDLQAATVAEASGAVAWRLAGELITANIYRLTRGQDSFTAINFYDPENKPITIKLDPALSPAENARAYFYRYNKACNAARLAREQLEKTRDEIAYLESINQALVMAVDKYDLAEIQRELRRAGYLPETKSNQRPGQKGKQKEAPRQSLPLEFTSPDGYKIFVGKNNRQNDWLTLKQAASSDLWLHAKDIPGSHVIIRTEGRQVPAATLEMAARLAARYSSAHQSSQVAVDYTLVKHVRKPAGAKPGRVIYDHQHTVYVTPAQIT